MRRSAIELDIKRWSAWAPGLEDGADWRAWADGDKIISGPIKPDVGFVERLLRRRLSPLNRMAFRVAANCLEGEQSQPLSIFCSRYGEFSRAFEILNDLASDEAVSPTTFSLSVHNTASSLFSIMQQNRAHSTALAGGETTLESAFLECWMLLQEHAALQPDAPTSALMVYCDQTLPEMFLARPETAGNDNVAVAFLLRLPQRDAASAEHDEDGENKQSPALNLSWRPSHDNPPGLAQDGVSSTLRLLRLLLKGGAPMVSNFGRLTWTWACAGKEMKEAFRGAPA